MVDSAEVGHNDRNRQSDDQHAAQRADGAEDLPHDGLWHHVAISEPERQLEVRLHLMSHDPVHKKNNSGRFL